MAPKPPEEWLLDLYRAATETGYGVLAIKPNRVRLARVGRPEVTVTIKSIFLDGRLVRELLAPKE